VVKYYKKIILIALSILTIAWLIVPIFAAYEMPLEAQLNAMDDNFSYVNDLMLQSSRYTQYKPLSTEQLQTYEDNKLNYTEEELQLMGYEKVVTHANGSELWFEQRSFSVIVVDEHGYMWSSRAEWQADLNNTPIVRRRMLSGLTIQYVNSASVKSGTVTSLPILDVTQALFKDFSQNDPDDAIYTERIRPYIIDRLQPNRVEISKKIEANTLITTVHYKADIDDRMIDIKFDVEMSLTNEGFNVYIPQSSIVEGHPTLRLVSINLFRYFGATLKNNQPGYLVIPEGVGALARFDRLQTESMSANYYATDPGFTNDRQAAHLNLPIYGIVHAENYHAMYAYLKQGTDNSTFQARLFEANAFNSAYNTYQVRTIFNRPIDRSGRTIQAILENPYPSNYEVEYRFLKDDKASYVGIANEFKDQLIKEGSLSIADLTQNKDSIPILLSYIMADKEKAFIGTKDIHMTRLEDVETMYQYFKENGINNQQTILSGWSKDGFVNRAPYRVHTLESRSKFEKLAQLIKNDQNHLILDNDYVTTTSLSSRSHASNHTMKSLSRVRYEYNLDDTRHKVFLLKPEVSLQMAINDHESIVKLGVTGLYSPSIGHTLFSSYEHGKLLSKADSFEIYEQLLSLYDVHYLNKANANVFKHMSAYTHMPTTNKQFTIYTDLVPILPIVLKGSVPYYGNYLNFNAIGNQRLLQMIDYGINPSYILTMEDTYKMRFTMAKQYFSTTFSHYQDEIVLDYHRLNDVLSHTIGARHAARQILGQGVVKNTYVRDNNYIYIYINYTNQVVNYEGITIPAESVEIV